MHILNISCQSRKVLDPRWLEAGCITVGLAGEASFAAVAALCRALCAMSTAVPRASQWLRRLTEEGMSIEKILSALAIWVRMRPDTQIHLQL